MTMTWRGSGTPLPPLPEPAYEGKHRAPRPLTVCEERIPTDYLAGVVRHMRADALTLDPTRLGPGFDIDESMQRSGIDADDALTAWRTAS